MVFISYSSKDYDSACAIRMVLQKNEIECWMAPESIPMGGDYSSTIPCAIENCDLFLLILSKNSQESNWVPKELDLAITNNRPIIPFQIDDEMLTKPFNFRLTNIQRIEAFHDLESAYSQLIKQIKKTSLKLSGGTSNNSSEDATETDISDWSFDEALSVKYHELFGAPRESEPISPLIKKAHSLKVKKFADIVYRNDDITYDNEVDFYQSLLPVNYQDEIGFNISYKGKHFFLKNAPGFKTIVFEIFEKIDYETKTAFYMSAPLDSIELNEDDSNMYLFFHDEIYDPQLSLLILHFNCDNGEAFANVAIIQNDKIRYSLTPTLLHFERKQFYKGSKLSPSTYSSDSLTKYEQKQAGETISEENMRWYKAEVNENAIIIIDPETALPVQRELYFDKQDNIWKAKIEIEPQKSYFSFQLNYHSTGGDTRNLSLIEIARYYRKGIYGFPRDALKAAEYYEKDGSPEALYEIACLFRSESSLYDEDTYSCYLNQAIEQNCEKALIDKAIDCIFSAVSKDITEAVSILEKVHTELGIKWFILGYITETKMTGGNDEEAFEFYYNSAKEKYKPAFARLGIENLDDGLENIKQQYLKSVSHNNTIANYCMGCVLFFGIGVFPFKAYGINLLASSATAENPRAIEALYSIFELDSDYWNEESALKWLKAIASYNPEAFNTLANRLLDGVGCEICEENDKLAFDLFQKASESGNMTALHNLGWMYKNGRGCEPNFEIALNLFQKAARPNSYYHMGDMYERGLGVPMNLDKAIELYRKGASEGSERAQKQLEVLGIEFLPG